MIEFWYTALASPRGIAIQTDDIERLKMKLYSLRAKNPDPALDALSIVIPPAFGELWIVKKEPANAG